MFKRFNINLVFVLSQFTHLGKKALAKCTVQFSGSYVVTPAGERTPLLGQLQPDGPLLSANVTAARRTNKLHLETLKLNTAPDFCLI